ncbi:hypothetical protein [Mumia sp. DW29H23]|uniref:hypothetical protein n=1 Tax=Mumia sp. DW29H23 TaxID=3421241 RepID=UPI003D69E4B0
MVAKLVTWSITLSAVAALSLVGGAGKGPAGDPAESLERMLVALGSGDYAEACEMILDGGTPVAEGDGSECAETMRVYAEGIRPGAVRRLRDITVEQVPERGSRVEISGDAVVGAPSPFAETVYELVRVDGKWYVAAG